MKSTKGRARIVNIRVFKVAKLVLKRGFILNLVGSFQSILKLVQRELNSKGGGNY